MDKDEEDPHSTSQHSSRSPSNHGTEEQRKREREISRIEESQSVLFYTSQRECVGMANLHNFFTLKTVLLDRSRTEYSRLGFTALFVMSLFPTPFSSLVIFALGFVLLCDSLSSHKLNSNIN